MKRLLLVMVLLATACGTAGEGGAFAPAGPPARHEYFLTWLMIVLGAVVYLVVGAVLFAALRRRSSTQADVRRIDRRLIIAGGLVLPAPILLALLAANIFVLAAQEREGTMRIEIEGYQYWWEVRYPEQGIVTANEVHIPTGQPIELVLSTDDVIHSWWVPELGGKRDLIPGQPNVLVIQADRPGVYRGQCAEFCGIQHANMAMFVVAHDPAEFADWVTSEATPAGLAAAPNLQRGQDVFIANCAGCHSVQGTPATGQEGPDLTHFASRMTIGAGAVPNDRGHLGGWVANSQSIKPGNLMPPIPIPASGMNDLLDYLESLK